MSEVASPPLPVVKVPLLRRFGGIPPKPTRVGRGYSVEEIRAVGLTVKEARHLGIYVDERRKRAHEENVQRLREWLEAVAQSKATPHPDAPEGNEEGGGRAFKGEPCTCQ